MDLSNSARREIRHWGAEKGTRSKGTFPTSGRKKPPPVTKDCAFLFLEICGSFDHIGVSAFGQL
eukprot:1858669-Amphidinium_carterae.1